MSTPQEREVFIQLFEKQVEVLQASITALKQLQSTGADSALALALAPDDDGKKKKKAKKVVDPDRPKRAPSGYQLFMNDKQSEILNKNPDIKQSDIMKEAGKLWADTKVDEKEIYRNRSAELKIDADEKIRLYDAGKKNGAKANDDNSKSLPSSSSKPSASTPLQLDTYSTTSKKKKEKEKGKKKDSSNEDSSNGSSKRKSSDFKSPEDKKAAKKARKAEKERVKKSK